MKQKTVTQTQLTIISALFDGVIFILVFLLAINMPHHNLGISSLAIANYIMFAFIYLVFKYRTIKPTLPTFIQDIFKSISWFVIAVPFVLGLEYLYFGRNFANHINILMVIILLFISLIVSRISFYIYCRFFFKKVDNRLKVLLVGANRSINKVIGLLNHPTQGIEIIGIMDNVAKKGEQIDGVPVLGKINAIEEVLDTNAIDMIVQIAGTENTTLLMTLAEHRRIRFMVLPQMFGLISRSIESVYFKDQLFLEPKGTALSGWSQVFKRLLDIIIALFFLILLSPIFLILGIITKLIYPKQRIFTSQNRVDGRSGREFKMWRFATLPKGAKEKVPTKLNYKDFSKQKDIKSLGRFAKFMRRSHLMDLPQFYNVLRGDMGIVGPRPPFLVEYENYDWFDRKRLLIKPGITGMWQINKTQDTFDEMVRLDKFYVENWSFWLDLKIVLISIFKFFFGRLDSR